ncbi:probable membrane protein YPO2362 [hydrothermal vent metagenome]|uniref:Probable membrane protein YPO2362 n=1 Tax=hydrothermal vent metagenome TaxID=652676 RepID=A0A1W1DY39_9ZZZZ
MIQKSIKYLANSQYSPAQLFFGFSFWLILIPPVSAFFGMYYYGWSLGISDPIRLPLTESIAISIFYFLALIAGFLITALTIKWMSAVYAPKATLKDAFAVVTVVTTPIMLGGIVHLYPSMLFHVIVLSPIFILSSYLIFASIPILLKTDYDRGIFMGCSLFGFISTAGISLLGISAIAWVNGIGPNLGV